MSRHGKEKASVPFVSAHCPSEMLKALGLVDEDGNQVVAKSVTVTITNFISAAAADETSDSDDNEREQTERNVAMSTSAVGAATRQAQPQDTHADDDIDKRTNSPTDCATNRYIATCGSGDNFPCQTMEGGYSVYGRVTTQRTDPSTSSV